MTKFKIVTICGSTKFKDEFIKAAKALTLDGMIVLTCCLFAQSGDEEALNLETKGMLDIMHDQKIDMSDCIYVINPGGYIGESTAREIIYAQMHGKSIEYLVEPKDKINKVI
jgi:hypothetical protein